jgi:hypothetical protein
VHVVANLRDFGRVSLDETLNLTNSVAALDFANFNMTGPYIMNLSPEG